MYSMQVKLNLKDQMYLFLRLYNYCTYIPVLNTRLFLVTTRLFFVLNNVSATISCMLSRVIYI